MQVQNSLAPPFTTTGRGPARLLASLALAVVASVIALDAQGRGDTFVGHAERTMAHGGRQRTYLVHDFDPSGPAPVVIVLHGGGGNAANAVKMLAAR